MKKGSFINRLKNERGQVLVLAALLMTVLMGFTAFAVDIGRVTVLKSKLQNAADAAALAGAGVSAHNIDAAKSTALSNGVDKDSDDTTVDVTLYSSSDETEVQEEYLYSHDELESLNDEQLIVLAKKHSLNKYITISEVNKYSEEFINSISVMSDTEVIQLAKDNSIYHLIEDYVQNKNKFVKGKRKTAEDVVKSELEILMINVDSLTEENRTKLIDDLLKIKKQETEVVVGENTTKVKVELSKKIPYTFAKILGFNDTTVSAIAVAESVQTNAIGKAADFAVFSEEHLKWNGGNFSIYGDVYGGKGIKFTGNGSEISGVFEYYSGSIDFGGDIIGGSNKVSNPIHMPNLLEKINESMNKIICNTQDEFNEAIKDGINGIIYFDSNSTLNINGRIEGIGIICANKNIVFKAEQTAEDKISFYSIEGNITFNGGSGSIYGVLYAPMGKIEINGTPHENKIYGRMIGKDVEVNGNGYKVVPSENDLDGINKIPGKKIVRLVE